MSEQRARPRTQGYAHRVCTLEERDVIDKLEESEYGRFGWVTDPEGNRVELWQPPA